MMNGNSPKEKLINRSNSYKPKIQPNLFLSKIKEEEDSSNTSKDEISIKLKNDKDKKKENIANGDSSDDSDSDSDNKEATSGNEDSDKEMNIDDIEFLGTKALRRKRTTVSFFDGKPRNEEDIEKLLDPFYSCTRSTIVTRKKVALAHGDESKDLKRSI